MKRNPPPRIVTKSQLVTSFFFFTHVSVDNPRQCHLWVVWQASSPFYFSWVTSLHSDDISEVHGFVRKKLTLSVEQTFLANSVCHDEERDTQRIRGRYEKSAACCSRIGRLQRQTFSRPPSSDDEDGRNICNSHGIPSLLLPPDIFVLMHESSIFRSVIQPCMQLFHDGTG